MGPKAREQAEEEEAAVQLDLKDEISGEREDDTGINKSKPAFDKIKKNIIDYYAGLGNPKDRKDFKIYMIANLELYFKSWEEADKDNLTAPTTPEIDDAVARGEAALEGGEEGEEEGTEEEGEEELDLEF